MATRPKRVNEMLVQHGKRFRIEKSADGSRPRWFVFELQDDDPTDSQDGVWAEAGAFPDEASAARMVEFLKGSNP